MSRLPAIGSDNGTWGTILNDYLSVSLAADGTINASTIGTSQIQDTSVTSTKIAAGAVTTTLIADGNVTKAKLEAAVQTSLSKADTALQTAPVTSVAAKTGAVLLTKSDVGLSQVDNTSDVNKPISTATQTALNALPTTTLDISKSSPRYMVSFARLNRTAVSRCVVKSPDTGDIYVSQSVAGSNGTSSPYETMVVNRMGKDGVYLDSMQFTDGGHGTNIALEYSSGTMYIWFAYQAPLGAGNPSDLVRVPYVGGATITRTDASIQTMNKFTTQYADVAFDWANNYVALRRTASSTQDVYELRKITELKAGTNTIYNTVTLTTNTPTIQGYCTVDSNLYVSVGASNEPAGDLDYIRQYKWADGSLVNQIATGAISKSPNGTYMGSTHEQESVTLYRDPVTSQASLLLAATVGASPNYKWMTFLFPSLGADVFAGDVIRTIEKNLPTLTSSVSKTMNGTATTLASVTTPGWWYFSPTEMQAMTDAPSMAILSSGHFLQVSGTDGSGGVVQTLYRSSSTTPDQFVRIVGASSSPWIQTVHSNTSGLTSGADISDQGYLAYSYMPEAIQGGNTIASGTLTGAKLRLPYDATISNFVVGVSTAGATFTANSSGIALYSATDTLLGYSADMATTFNSIGMKTVPLITPVAVKAGYIKVVVWAVASTLPGFVRSANVSATAYNDNLTAANYRYFTANTGITTSATLPATLGTKTSSTAAWWFAVR